MQSEIEAMEALLGGDSLSPLERRALTAQLQARTSQRERVARKETQSLAASTDDEIAYATETLVRLERLRTALPRLIRRAKATNTSPSELLQDDPELLELYWHLMAEGKSIDAYRNELSTQRDQLRSLRRRITEFGGEFDPASTRQFTSEAAFVSEVTGETYPLVLMIGEAPESVKNRLAAARTGGFPEPGAGGVAYSVADVTSAQTQKVYYGYSRHSGPEGHREAIDDAFSQFGDDATYGEGMIAVRLPPGPGGAGGDHPGTEVKTYRSEEGVLQKVLWALGIIAAVAGIAALVATGVGAGAAAGILGAVAATAGAVTAIHNIQERERRHTLELDAELLLDVISIIGVIPAVAGARATLSTAAGVRTAIVGERFLQIYAVGETGATVILVPTKLAQDIQRIQSDPDLSPQQKQLMIAQARLGAFQSGLMLLGSAAASRAGAGRRGRIHVDEFEPGFRQQIELLELEGFGEYRSMQERGWIDENGNWTDHAPEAVRGAPTHPETAPSEAVPPETMPPEAAPPETVPPGSAPPEMASPEAAPPETGRRVSPPSEERPPTEAEGPAPETNGETGGPQAPRSGGSGPRPTGEPGTRFRVGTRTIDRRGELTDEGVEVLRREFPHDFAGDSDSDVKNAFARDISIDRRGRWHEALIKYEVRESHAASTGVFVASRDQNLNTIFQEVEARGLATVVNRQLLGRRARSFVASDPVLRAEATRLLNHPDRALRRSFRHWYRTFGRGLIGRKKPDIIEFIPGRNLAVVSDPTLAVPSEFGPIHAFKTLFYKRVLETATNLEVGAMDIAPGLVQVIGE